MKSAIRSLARCIARAGAAAVVGLATGALGSASAIVLDPAGAFATGSVSGDLLIGCTTCGHFPLTMTGSPEQSSGGSGFATAAISYSGFPLSIPDYTSGGSASYAAQAGFSGIAATPVLKARASADNVSVFLTSEPNVQVGVNTFQTSAMAQGIQRYTFTGATDTTYTFNFRVDGSLRTSQAGFSASASFHDAGDPFLEVSLANGGVSRNGEGVSQTTTFDESFSVAVTFQAGMTYYMRTRLTTGTAFDYASTSVIADAYNTFLVTSITGGDTGLLVAGIAPVPEPEAYAMFALGLAMIGLARRRTRASL